jgi:hypothetical protein
MFPNGEIPLCYSAKAFFLENLDVILEADRELKLEIVTFR